MLWELYLERDEDKNRCSDAPVVPVAEKRGMYKANAETSTYGDYQPNFNNRQ
jgi:hypothetical protein